MTSNQNSALPNSYKDIALKTDVEIAIFDQYGDEINICKGPVGLLAPFYLRHWAVEMKTYELGVTREEIFKSLDDLLQKFPKEKFYCSYYTHVGYKSEAFKTAFIKKFYDGDSRIPIRDITDEEIDECDGLAIRAHFMDKNEYLQRTKTCGNAWSNSLPKTVIKFYQYKCDRLYKQSLLETQESAVKGDYYLMTIPNPEDLYVVKLGYVMDDEDRIDKAMQKVSEDLGERFIEWVDDRRISILIKEHEGKNYPVVYADYPGGPSEHLLRTFTKEAEKQLQNALCHSEQEYKELVDSLATYTQVGFFPHEYVISEYRNTPILDFWDAQMLMFGGQQDKNYSVLDTYNTIRSVINTVRGE